MFERVSEVGVVTVVTMFAGDCGVLRVILFDVACCGSVDMVSLQVYVIADAP